MEVLAILKTLVLGFVLWDIHRGTREIMAIARDMHQEAADSHRTTDARVRRVPPTP